MEELKLKVAEAVQDDVNKGIVRADSALISAMGLRAGDIVEIKGEKTTVCIIDRAYPGDIGLKIIRMDGPTRRNAKTGIGDYVSIKKADAKEAKKIVIAPAQKGISVRAPSSLFKQGLLGRAVMKGDIVSLGGTRRRRATLGDNPYFSEMFNIMNDTVSGFGLGDLKFVVADASPKGALVISELTEVEFNPTAVDIEEEAQTSVDVSYEDIGGMDDEISKIREMVELPLKHPELFEQLGIEPPKGVLLHGPPGTGKTLLARAVANETNSNFTVINGPEIMSKFYGESEQNLRKIFEDAEKNAPSIIFIDEIDAIAGNREESKGEVERRVVAQLLTIMDGLKSRGRVVVIAATNIPNSIDPALRRPGRFDRELEITPPNKDGRFTVLKIHTRNMPIKPSYELTTAQRIVTKDIESAKEKILHLETLEKTPQNEAKLKNKKSELAILEKIAKQIDGLKPKEFIDAMYDGNGLSQDERSKIHSLLLHDLLQDIAESTHGFVGADLAALSR
ncbi:MAG: AAA family ATPase, partial [Candidatus Woesearchaeota archaeon]